MLPDSSWTTGPSPALRDEGLHEAFARVAAARPGAPAVVSSRRTVTYGELDGTADSWAAALAAAGVTRGDLVPIALPRSVELVTALLAVLKAGAAYALLDPSWPARRRHEIVEQLAAPLLIDGAGPGDHQGRAAVAGVPAWTPPSSQPSSQPSSAPSSPAAGRAGFRPAAVAGSDPCCVFFTSGTTGRPKGVLTPHRATARLFQPGSFARFAAGTVVPLAAPVPWDAFSLELWSVLLTGGTSLIVDEPYLSAGSLRAAVSRHGVDTSWLTSSLFNMVVDEDLESFDGLRQVMIGGERLSPGHVARFLRRFPGIVLLNGYGPVESTVFATTHRITEADCARPGGIPLGRPVPGTQVYVMNADEARLCAVGEVGEICVAGDGLALRYLGDDALTAAKFTRVRIGDEERRVYRTGDLGVWAEDGLLHFRGRADRQLKIRGHRVEPAEVERQIEELLPSVRQCRVLARRDAAGVPQELVAFCVPAAPGDPLAGALPALRAALVSYHRPAAVVSVPAFPVTDRGKLDERALLALPAVPGPASPDGAAGREGTDLDPSHGDATVRAVAETFRAVLGRASVPLDVPFVELGGTSLGAGRVCARLAARLGRPVPVSLLYRHPTVSSLAGWLRTHDDGAAGAPEPAAPGAPGEAPLTPMQVVYLTRHLVDPADLTGHCLLIWAIEGELDRAALAEAIAAVHDRHPALRAAYVADPRPVALDVDISPPALEELPACPSVDAAVAALRAELTAPLEPTDGDVWRTVLVPVAAGAVTLFGCVVHHIAFDGWSESVLAADLAAGYAAAAASSAPAVPPPRPLPPAPVPLGPAAAGPAAGAELAAHGEYLRAELAGVPALRWPAEQRDRASAVPGAAGPIHVEVPLAPGLVAAVDAVAAAAGVTRFAVLLCSYAGALAEVTGQRDFAVGVPVAQRDGPHLEHAIGCHITMVCVRMRGPALGGDVAAVRETGRLAGRALAAQDVPFAEVVRLVDPPRTGRPPIYQTLFALQDNALPRLRLPGLRTTFLRQPYAELPLELHAEVWPDADADSGGGLRLVVSARSEAVPDGIATELAKRFTDRLHTLPSGVRL